MKALVIPQPYAAAILDGFTNFYSTGRPTSYRGRVAILSAGHRHLLRDHIRLRRAGYWRKEYQLGALLGTAELTDCVRSAFLEEGDPFGVGRFVYIFKAAAWNAQAIRYRGRSAIFDIPDLYLDTAPAALIDGKAAAFTPANEG